MSFICIILISVYYSLIQLKISKLLYYAVPFLILFIIITSILPETTQIFQYSIIDNLNQNSFDNNVVRNRRFYSRCFAKY